VLLKNHTKFISIPRQRVSPEGVGALKLINVDGVTKRFGGLVALSNVDFTVDEGEIVGLIGPNGAGKTTLFNVISGTFPPTEGRIKFEGKDISRLGAYKICRLGVARTFQTPKPFPNMTVYENVFSSACFGCTEDKGYSYGRQELNGILDKFGLTAKSMAYASGLTVFEMRMLEVARALSTKPRLLLLDEVMAGLNPTETASMIRIIKELRDKEGKTIFMIEHNMRAIMEIADRIIVLQQGMKIAEGTPKEIAKNPRVIKAYLGEAYA
jgi:branched-chain amino acid transport system ATP-binding protein